VEDYGPLTTCPGPAASLRYGQRPRSFILQTMKTVVLCLVGNLINGIRLLYRQEAIFASSICLVASLTTSLFGQSGNAGTIRGTVVDQTGAAIKAASVEIQNPVSHYSRTATSDTQGNFEFDNVPYNPYHLSVAVSGFQNATQDVDVRTAVTTNLKITLQVGAVTSQVTVEGAADLVEATPFTHTDIDRNLFDKLPNESVSSELSSLVTLTSPGISADSNGLFHGLGDHAENSFSLDGQPITDQQSKVFSNQIPLAAVQSMEVIEGAPPAEYGDKTSVVIDVTTRSGQGVKTPTGSVNASYGTFGTTKDGFDLAYGGNHWGNFIGLDVTDTGRFLDPPEFQVMHDRGNEENLFDRIDYQVSTDNTLHLNLGFTRSWFQTPNTYDQEYHPNDFNPITGAQLGPSDQRSQIKTFNISPTWNAVLSPFTVFTFGAFWRQDQYNYYPSADPFNDYSPDLLSESFGQSRRLLNVGGRTSLSYARGIHNLKIGLQYEHTFLTEGDNIGIMDPNVIPSFNCQNPDGSAIPGTPCAALLPYDLTEGGSFFSFHGHTDVKEFAAYVQDAIKVRNWTFNLGLRLDQYNGLASKFQLEPRLGISYNIKGTGTVMRISYARTLETPFNENLIIASQGCNVPFLSYLVPPPGVPCMTGPITPGWRNEFHVGLEQAFGRYLVFDGEYIWKYTHDGFDFGVVGSTPLTFPIEWTASKIPGFAFRISVPNYHGFTAQVVMSSVAARFFEPQVAGLPIIPPVSGVFRIDHDELFNETLHLQYQPSPRMPWFSFNWRYDSGLVAGATPCVNVTATCLPSTSVTDGGSAPIPSGQVALVNTVSGLPLTADQEFQAGLTCNGQLAAPNPLGPALATCPASAFGSKFLQVPAPGTENDDHNPQRIQPRHVFDIGVGDDNVFHGDRYKWSARVTVVNLTDKVALYNFLSTFSGTHYLTPRTVTGTIGFHF
jgi:hypothetical protein